MSASSANPFDTDLLDRPPGSELLGKLGIFAATVILGVGLAVVTAMSPVIGVGVTVGLAGLLLVVRVPQIILVAFAVALGVPVQVSLGSLPFNAADAILVGWWLCIPLILVHHGAPNWRMPILVKAVLPFVAAVFLSMVLASDPPGQFNQFTRIVEWFVALPLAISFLRPTSGLLKLMAIVLMIVPCLFAIDGVVEFVTNGHSISHMLGIPVPGPKDTSNKTIHHTFDVSHRAGSTFGGPQGLAVFLDMVIAVAMAHLVRGPTRLYRAFGATTIALCIGGLVTAESRGGVIGAVMVLFVCITLMRPRLGKAVALAAAVFVAVALLVIALWPGWDGTIASLVPGGRPDAVIDRLTIWRSALRVWRDHPLIGVGLGNFRDHALRRPLPLLAPLGYESFHAHNTYFEVLADTGIIGLACYLGFLWAVMAALLRRWREVRDDRTTHAPIMTMAAMGTLCAYIAFGTVDLELLENTPMLVALVLTLGLLKVPLPATQTTGTLAVATPAYGRPTTGNSASGIRPSGPSPSGAGVYGARSRNTRASGTRASDGPSFGTPAPDPAS